MKRFFLFVMVALVAVGFYWFKPDVYAQPGNLAEAERQQLLAATVQIRLHASLRDETGNAVLVENNGTWHTQEMIARGLGTLVQLDSQLFIVTHDHWGDLLATAETAQFYNANGVLLVEISGAVFRNLLHYRDQGTLLLAAPPELPLPLGVMGNGRELAVGSQVFLTRYQPGYEVVEVVVARVTAVTEREGIPAYLLQTVDGTPVVPGDSGGGVWFEGQLVGNLWRNQAVETVPTTGGAETMMSQTVTDMSVAAAFSAVAEKIMPGELGMEVQPGREEGVRP